MLTEDDKKKVILEAHGLTDQGLDLYADKKKCEQVKTLLQGNIAACKRGGNEDEAAFCQELLDLINDEVILDKDAASDEAQAAGEI